MALITTLIKTFKRLQGAKGQDQDVRNGARGLLGGGVTDLLPTLPYSTLQASYSDLCPRHSLSKSRPF